MKVTKYDQSCILIETKGKRILIDPGKINYTNAYLDIWRDIDAILVTHRHPDHCNKEAIDILTNRDNISVYTTKEVQDNWHLDNCILVKANDVIMLDTIQIEVTEAYHGYLTVMTENNTIILENVGYIVDDGEKRLYHTSDTINFPNNYHCDILCMPFNDNGITMGLYDGVDFIKNIHPKMVLPIHRQHPIPYLNPNEKELDRYLTENDIPHTIWQNGDTIVFE